ncbi:unnamed protein product [Closterium sp. Yama58-4]|nr:unnamed protein product [Closterium sp. Yama58-4]
MAMAASLQSSIQTASFRVPVTLHSPPQKLSLTNSFLPPLSPRFSRHAVRCFDARDSRRDIRHDLQKERAGGAETAARMQFGEFGEFEHVESAFDYADEEFSRATVLEATSVSSSGDALLVGMTDGISFKCSHNLMDGVRLPEYPAQPAAVLKLEDGSRILLPILIPHLSSQMLIDSVRGVPLARPTVYMLMRDMIELMGYEISLIRITHRDGDAYCARAYLSKVSADSDTASNSSSGPAMMSLDMRPSDAINLASRAKVPIQVRKSLAVADGVRIVGMVRAAVAHGHGGRLLRRQRVVLTSDDKPDLEDLSLADEFALVRLMEEAAQHERYGDAAKIKDQLTKLRRRTNKV